MNEWKNEQINNIKGLVNKWIKEKMNEWKNEWKDEWMHEWINECPLPLVCRQ